MSPPHAGLSSGPSAPLAVALLVYSLFACAAEEIAFVTDRTSESSVDAGAGPERSCGAPEECEVDEYCALPGCGAVRGICRPRLAPSACGTDFEPVCGCDGVTYFNDCLREASRMSAATPGACLRNAQICGANGFDPCPEGLFCAKLLPLAAGSRLLALAACFPQLPGVCWVLPDRCATEPGDDAWISCADGASARCTDACSAIRSQLPHVPASSCP